VGTSQGDEAAEMIDKFFEWFRKVPDWLIVLALGVLAGKWYVEREKDKVRKEERERAAAREKEAELETVNAIRTVEQGSRTSADQAIAARDAVPPVSDADGVHPSVAARIFSD
jgi:aryl-alcohol dehydrogenase-like predicted oxidoreductase